MTARYFGEPWDAPAVDDATPADTPVGTRCTDCQEPVAAGDRGWLRHHFTRSGAALLPVHAECDLRGVVGHEFGLCTCTGHPPDRATARLVWQRVFAGR